MGDVLPALGELNTDSTILLNGTLLHNEALLVMLGKDPTLPPLSWGHSIPRANQSSPSTWMKESSRQKGDVLPPGQA